MTAYLETKRWHPKLTNGGIRTIDPDVVAAIRKYWLAGEKPSCIATKCGVGRMSVIRYCEDLPAQQQHDRLTYAEVSEYLRGW